MNRVRTDWGTRRRLRTRAAAVAGAAAALMGLRVAASAPVPPACQELEATLANIGGVPAAGANFGVAAAIANGVLYVGAPGENTTDIGAGRVYGVNLDSGLRANFTVPANAYNAAFGSSLAVAGGRILIGAPGTKVGAADFTGRAYLFDVNSGQLLHTFENPTPDANDSFGSAVALDGNYAAIAAITDDAGAENTGSVHIFSAVTGAFIGTLPRVGPAPRDDFGASLAIDGGKVLVGAPGAGGGTGRAYRFDAATLAPLTTYAKAAPADGDQFGAAVDIAGGRVLVGAPFDDAGGADAGRAYLFDEATGSPLRSLDNPTPEGFGERFAGAVKLTAEYAFVGSSADQLPGPIHAGRAYQFRLSDGGLARAFEGENPAEGDRFGSAVAVEGDRLAVGANRDDTLATDSGSATVFEISSGDLLDTLRHPGPNGGEQFGASVAMAGGIYVAGMPEAGATHAGRALLMDSNQSRVHMLDMPEAMNGARFGAAVAVGADMVLVGAPGAHQVFTFDAATGQRQGQFINLGLEGFGAALAISGDTEVIGAPDAGRAVILPPRSVGSPWIVDDGTSNTRFGAAVAISGDIVVVGAPDAGETAAPPAAKAPTSQHGAAYVYSATDGGLVRELLGGGENFSHFGAAVAIDGDLIAVGEPDHAGVGQVFLFLASTGAGVGVLAPPAAGVAKFGTSVAVDGLNVLVGATTSADGSGVAFLFDAESGQLRGTFAKPPATVRLRSGNGAIGGSDSQVRRLLGPADAPFPSHLAPADFDAARAGDAAAVIEPNPAWLANLADAPASDPDAQWIAPVSGGAFNGFTALYAQDFIVDATMLSLSVGASFRLICAVDNRLGDGVAGTSPPDNVGIYLNGIPLPCPSEAEGFQGQLTLSCADAQSLLRPGLNTLYVNATNDAAGPGGLIYSATIELQPFLPGFEAGPGDRFGAAVAMEGDSFIVGIPGNYFLGVDAGAAYVYGCPASPGRVLDVLLGRRAGQPRQDLNADGAIDMADYLKSALAPQIQGR